MRLSFSSAALALLSSGFCVAAGAVPAPQGEPEKPSEKLVSTVCDSDGAGLLVRGADQDGAAADDAAEDFPELFDSLAGDEPRTRFLKYAPPQGVEDAATDSCRARMDDLYENYGDELTAVPAPKGLTPAEIESNGDRIFDLISESAQAVPLSALKDDDLDPASAPIDPHADALDRRAREAQMTSGARADHVLNGDFAWTPRSAVDDDPPAAGPSRRAATDPPPLKHRSYSEYREPPSPSPDPLTADASPAPDINSTNPIGARIMAYMGYARAPWNYCYRAVDRVLEASGVISPMPAAYRGRAYEFALAYDRNVADVQSRFVETDMSGYPFRRGTVLVWGNHNCSVSGSEAGRASGHIEIVRSLNCKDPKHPGRACSITDRHFATVNRTYPQLSRFARMRNEEGGAPCVRAFEPREAATSI